jgi:hypothetical protein
MAQITISDLHPIENEFAELSDLELESVVGGKGGKDILRNVAKAAGGFIGVGVSIPF